MEIVVARLAYTVMARLAYTVMARLDRTIALTKLVLTGLMMLMVRSRCIMTENGQCHDRAMTCVGDGVDVSITCY